MTAEQLAARYEDSARALHSARRDLDERRAASLLLDVHRRWAELFARVGRGWARVVIEERRRRA